jgi:hypothetical protein
LSTNKVQAAYGLDHIQEGDVNVFLLSCWILVRRKLSTGFGVFGFLPNTSLAVDLQEMEGDLFNKILSLGPSSQRHHSRTPTNSSTQISPCHEIIQYFQSHPADIHLTDQDGISCLHWFGSPTSLPP